MITSLRLKDFKNFVDEKLHLGPLTIIVGANASGKSNLRDYPCHVLSRPMGIATG